MRVVQGASRAGAVVLAVLLCALPVGPAGGAVPQTPSSAARALPGQPTPPQSARERTSRPARAKTPVAVILDSVGPKTVRPSSRVTVTGYLQNQSGQPITGALVRLRWRTRPVNGRTELTQFAGNTPPALISAGASKPVPGAVAPGGQASWRLDTTARQLGMKDFGVYAIGVEALSALGQPLGSQTTFLTFMPSAKAAQPKPTKVAWVWPMIDRPRRASDTTFVDDQLESDLGPTGRLGSLARVGEQGVKNSRTPITWAIDPALLDDVREMTKGYTVKNAKQPKGARRPKSKVAETWLNQLRLPNDPYFTTPYADPDEVALVRQRLGRHLKVAYGNMAVAKDIMGRPQASAIGWPVNGVAGQQTLDAMAGYGTKTFLMSSEVLISPDPQGYTAGATTTLQTARDTKPTLVYDSTISDVISGDTRSPGTEVLAEQRFLAETAMITAEMPNRPRTLVITPQRRWNPKPEFAENLLNWTAKAPWLKDVPLSSLEKAAPERRTFTGYPVGYERYELGDTYLKNVEQIAARAARFASIFDRQAGQLPANAYERAVLRMESTYWRGRDRRARSFRQSVSAAVDAAIDQVHLVPAKRIGLAGNNGFIPVTVANDLEDLTANVVLRVTPQNPGRLEIGGGAKSGAGREWRLRIRPGLKETVNIPVEVNANGYTILALELLAPEQKRKFGEDRSITVHTTGYGRMALLITGGALAVLFIGVGMRVLRARRRNVAEESDGAEVGGHPGG
jgi:hypothetical protein